MSAHELARKIVAHYTPLEVMRAFDRVIGTSGNDRQPLRPEDLASVDQFHIGGIDATLALAALADVGPETLVLDIGGGFGGPARVLSSIYGCRVVVLDLTEEYCDVGKKLTARCGLEESVSFVHGDGLAIPFPDATFDCVWTQHSSMNIADKPQLYREVHRVLRPAGTLALYEVMAGPVEPLLFPVPWAAEPSISFLSPNRVIELLLVDTGFRTLVWEDLSDYASATILSRPLTADMPGMHLILGEDFLNRLTNMARNLVEHRATLVRAVLQRS